MMKEHNKGKKPGEKWVPPPGYKSALGKARDAQKAEEAKRKNSPKPVKSMAPVHAEDTASDSDSDSDCSIGSRHVQAVRRRFTRVQRGTPASRAMVKHVVGSDDANSLNPFTGIEDDVQSYDLAVLNRWAKCQTASHAQLPQKQRKKVGGADKLTRMSNYVMSNKKPDGVEPTLILNNDKDIDKVAPLMTPLPAERKKINKVLNKVADISLEPDERLCLVDSGSFTHAIDAAEQLPGFNIVPLKDSQQGRDGESASGEIMRRLGKVQTDGTVDGLPLHLSWDVMKVKVPIISVRKLVRDYHNVAFRKHGGYIKNLKTGHRLPFFEHQGVYYIKYKLQSPNDDPLFGRQAA